MNPHFLRHCPFKGLCKSNAVVMRRSTVWYCWEIDSARYCRYCGETDSARSDTVGWLVGKKTKNLIKSVKSYQNQKYINPLVSGPALGRFEWWKNWKSISRWNVPLNMIQKSYIAPRPQYHTAGRLTLRSIIPRGYWFCAVWYCSAAFGLSQTFKMLTFCIP